MGQFIGFLFGLLVDAAIEVFKWTLIRLAYRATEPRNRNHPALAGFGLAGAFAEVCGRYLASRGQEAGYLATFTGGALFVLAVAGVCFVLVKG